MAMVRWDPFRDLTTIRNRMDRLVDEMVGTRAREGSEEEPLQTSWVPAIDVFEDQNTIRLHAELPGLTADDIQLSVEDSRLIIQGEKRMRHEADEGDYRRVEARYGSFYRSFPLPNTVDQDHIDADFENGVLEVTLPKVEAAKPKRIELKAH